VSIASQLNQLQEADLELESGRQALERITSELGESEVVVEMRTRLAVEQEHLEELKRQQHSAEWEIDDLSNKINALEKKLYSGEVTNPKELTNLQHDIDGLKARRGHLEDKALEIMGQVELSEDSSAAIGGEYETLEAEWQGRQQQLSADMEQLKVKLSALEEKRQLLAAGIDSQTYELYEQLRKQKATAVAKVEQGICRGCRISLSTIELQRARSGKLLQCSSCGRILFLA